MAQYGMQGAAQQLTPDQSGDMASVLSRDIPWETYMTARLISDAGLQLIRRYDKRPPELQASLLDEAGPSYVEAFLTVLRNVTKEETVQYILALLLQMLQANPGRAQLFHARPPASDPYPILLRLLQRSDWFTQDKACQLLVRVLQARPHKDATLPSHASSGQANGAAPSSSNGASSSSSHGVAPADPAEACTVSLVDWLCSQLRRYQVAPSSGSGGASGGSSSSSSSAPAVPRQVVSAMSALAVLLREKRVRAIFTQAGGVGLLAPLLRAAAGPTSSQLAYEICLCLWQLSFYEPAVAAMGAAGVVRPLVDVVKAAQKEKVVRVGLLALRNLLAGGDAIVASDMVDAGLPKAVASRALQSWGDEDIPEVLEGLGEALREQAVHVSSWDKYKKEVLSGALDWSPMHTSEPFWRQNVQAFEDKDFQLLRVLLKLLETSRDSRTLAVAANDVGRFVEFHPHGRYIVNDLRGKEMLMRLMSSSDLEVQKRALLAVQRIMLPRDKLDFLQGQAAQGQAQGAAVAGA